MQEPPARILIVVGAHLDAEREDRPLAYHLREGILQWLHSRGLGDAAQNGLRVVVCSDMLYLNQDDLRDLPALSVGRPDRNALSAYWADKLPSILAVEDRLMIQGDASFDTPVASIWGIDAEQTTRGVTIFIDKYLEGFMDAATMGW